MPRKRARGRKAAASETARGLKGLDGLPWEKVTPTAAIEDLEGDDDNDGGGDGEDNDVAGMFMLEEIPANSYTLGEEGNVVSFSNVIDVVPGSVEDAADKDDAAKDDAEEIADASTAGAEGETADADLKPSKRALRRKKMQEKKRNQELHASRVAAAAAKKDGDEGDEGEGNDVSKPADKAPKAKGKASAKREGAKEPAMDPAALQAAVSEWVEFGFEETLLEGIASRKFKSPTPIQRACLPKAMQRGMDILGAAETGSGKTLAFGLPILNGLIADPPGPEDKLAALIITPTRELAVQVAKHLRGVIVRRFEGIRVETLVGGMSQAKQSRVLEERPAVLVATPGRLWAMIDEGAEHLSNLASSLRYLAVDEADRMFDKGSFPDLKPLIQQLARNKEGAKRKRQTFLFSATLMTEGASDDLKKNRKRKRRDAGKDAREAVSPLVALMEHIGVRKTALCDLSRKAATDDEGSAADQADRSKAGATASKVQLPENLQLCSMESLPKDKDLFLYYFVMEHRGRTLVFVNTISSLRRVAGTLRLLNVENVATLHANMQQKLRLRHLERFAASERGVLVATDVAARGLDIPGIDHVVHYALPKRLDSFVHRSGRTARASRSGVCLSLVDPSEAPVFAQICRAISDRTIVTFPVRMATLSRMRERVTLARRIQQLESKLQEKAERRKWFRQNAKEAGIELDDTIEDGEDHLLEKQHQHAKEASSLRARLSELLQERILGAGVSAKYVSTNPESDRDIVLKDVSRKAGDEIATAPQSKLKRRRRR